MAGCPDDPGRGSPRLGLRRFSVWETAILFTIGLTQNRVRIYEWSFRKSSDEPERNMLIDHSDSLSMIRQREDGFTLVECIIVTAIISILALPLAPGRTSCSRSRAADSVHEQPQATRTCDEQL